MKFSESLRRGVMESFAGGITNKFKIKRRRFTLFFEDILANYIKEAEKRGYGQEMQDIGEKWGMLGTVMLTPSPFKKLPVPLFSKVANALWTSIGILRDFSMKKEGDIVSLVLRDNTISRIVGENRFETGCFAGIMGAYFGSRAVPVKVEQTREVSRFEFRITSEKIEVSGKDKSRYDKLNAVPHTEGFTLKDALRRKIFQLRGNRLYFRGRSICNSENTLFHILANEGIMLDRVAHISRKYFTETVDSSSPADKRLSLLKNVLHVMGWGLVKIVFDRNEVLIEIRNPPHGLQSEDDNWDFIGRTILGFMKSIDSGYVMKSSGKDKGRLSIRYGK